MNEEEEGEQNPNIAGTEKNCPVPKKRCYSKIARVEKTINKLQKLCETRGNVNKPSTSQNKPDEYEIFASHIASQLRQLPIRSFLKLQEKFQSLITQERLDWLPVPSTSTSSNCKSPMLSGMDSEEEDRQNEFIFTENELTYTSL